MVCQVETSPEILLVYRAHLVMIGHYILAADTRCMVRKNAQSWNVQFKFAPPCMRVTATQLAVALYSPVHSNRVRGPDADKAVKDRNVARTHIYIYIIQDETKFAHKLSTV
jgi:hypothetical protein